MNNEQAEFDENLEDLAGLVATFAQYTKMEQIEEIFHNVESVNDRLKLAQGQAKLFNSREGLFGKEATDYSQVQSLIKEWQPFSDLWVTAFHWIHDSKQWL